ALRPEIEDARPDKAEVQEGRRRARAAVKHKSHGAVRSGVFLHIRGIEDGGRSLTRLVVESERAGGRLISETALRCVDGMLGDGIFREQPQHTGCGASLLGGDLVRCFAVRRLLRHRRSDWASKKHDEENAQGRCHRLEWLLTSLAGFRAPCRRIVLNPCPRIPRSPTVYRLREPV